MFKVSITYIKHTHTSNNLDFHIRCIFICLPKKMPSSCLSVICNAVKGLPEDYNQSEVAGNSSSAVLVRVRSTRGTCGSAPWVLTRAATPRLSSDLFVFRLDMLPNMSTLERFFFVWKLRSMFHVFFPRLIVSRDVLYSVFSLCVFVFPWVMVASL